jgi:hypothetical protein
MPVSDIDHKCFAIGFTSPLNTAPISASLASRAGPIQAGHNVPKTSKCNLRITHQYIELVFAIFASDQSAMPAVRRVQPNFVQLTDSGWDNESRLRGRHACK